MNIQNNGLNRSFFFRTVPGVFLCCISLPILIVGIWWFGTIPSHAVTMHNFKRTFATLEHPAGAILIQRYTYFGADPDSGNTASGCYYYRADVRTLPTSLEEVERHYDVAARRSTVLMESEVAILPIAEDTPLSLDDFFLTGIIEEALGDNHIDSYIVYIKKVETDMFGDFRCWIL